MNPPLPTPPPRGGEGSPDCPFGGYVGRRHGELAAHPLTRRGVELWLERLLGWYGETGVDIEIVDGQLLLTDETADYIYTDFTGLESRYVPGSRPFLERHLARHVPGDLDACETALAIMRLCRDNRDMGIRGAAAFDGGTEEELIKRGASMCNELSRLFCCLAQIAGLAARYVGHHISGHATQEVSVDGRWWWMDAQKGAYAVDEDDRPLSARDLRRDPTAFERQPLAMWDQWHPTGPFTTDPADETQRAFYMARCRDCYFRAEEAVAIGNYFVWGHDRYTYPWHVVAADEARLKRARRDEALNRKALGWPDWYHNHLLFDEPFKHG